MRRIKVAVIMGGPSSEYEVSLASGENVLSVMDRGKYDPVPIIIGKDGVWPMPIEELIGKIDLAFLAVHGEYGEDGHLQMLLENLGIPYTGTGPRGSALGMNKSAAAKVFRARGLLVPEAIDIPRHSRWADIETPFGFPVVVKPMDRGSSVGVNVVRNERELTDALCTAFDFSKHARIERYISGRELTCGVIEDERGDIPLPPTEIIPKKAYFFDYHSKYAPDASKEVTPAHLPSDVTKAVQHAALIAHSSVDGKGVTRTDMILGNDGRLYVLEINTLPGLTKTSLIPQQCAASGISLPMLIDKIIADALRRFGVGTA